MTRLVFLDTETTSLDDRHGEVWEIGMIVRDPGLPDVEHLWQLYPNLEDANPTSLRVCHFYERIKVERDWVRRGVKIDGKDINTTSPYDIAYTVARLLDGSHVVGAVPDFDYRFMRKFLGAHNQCWTAHYHLIDVETLAVGYLRGLFAQAAEVIDATGQSSKAVRQFPDLITGLPWKTTTLYRAIGIDPALYEAHTALGDARCVRDVYDRITDPAAPAAKDLASAA